MSYTPPDGSKVGLELGGAYAPPAGNKVALELAPGAPPVGNTQYFFPAGVLTTAVGAHALESMRRHLGFAGADTFAAGAAEVAGSSVFPQVLQFYGTRATEYGAMAYQQTGEFPVLPTGWVSARYGQPVVYNSDQWLAFSNDGARYTAFGAASVYVPWEQTITPIGADSARLGVARVEHDTRRIEQRAAYAGPIFGGARFAHKDRTITFPWAVFTQYGNAAFGRHSALLMQGADFARMSAGHGFAHGNVLKPQGVVHVTRFGAAWVTRSPRVLTMMQRQPATEFGSPRVDLGRRYLQVAPFPWESEGTKWGGYTHVLNRDRVLGVVGLSAFRSTGAHDVVNAARALRFAPVHAGAFGAQLLAARVRRVSPDGVDSFRTTKTGTSLHNGARVVGFSGAAYARVGGLSNVVSNRRALAFYAPPVEAVGVPFVGYAVRAVIMRGWNDPQTRYGRPVVSLAENYIQPHGVNPGGVGQPFFMGPFRRTITPWYSGRVSFGQSTRIWNRTPQVYPPGRPYSELGHPRVDFRVRAMGIEGVAPVGISGHALMFRDRVVSFRALDSLALSQTGHQLRNALPDPPAVRTISFQNRGVNALVVGAPVVGAQAIRPDGLLATRFGGVSFRLQGAHFKWVYPSSVFGAHRVEPLNRPIYPEGTPPLNAAQRYGWARFSPHTIWARTDTPLQAVVNNGWPPGNTSAAFRPVNAHINQTETPGQAGYMNSQFPWFGHAHITHRVRRVGVTHGPSSEAAGGRVGDAALVHRWRRIYPAGFVASGYGYPVMHPHARGIWAWGGTLTAFGGARVGNAVLTQRAGMVGGSLTEWGAARVENQHRALSFSGAVCTEWGANTPLVHFPRRREIGGYLATQWGVARVEFLNRQVVLTGVDGFESFWTTFNDRMRVRRVPPPVQYLGATHTRWGQATLRNTQQFIRPYMIPPPRLCCTGLVIEHG